MVLTMYIWKKQKESNSFKNQKNKNKNSDEKIISIKKKLNALVHVYGLLELLKLKVKKKNELPPHFRTMIPKIINCLTHYSNYFFQEKKIIITFTPGLQWLTKNLTWNKKEKRKH